jgi:hypothetical protein
MQNGRHQQRSGQHIVARQQNVQKRCSESIKIKALPQICQLISVRRRGSAAEVKGRDPGGSAQLHRSYQGIYTLIEAELGIRTPIRIRYVFGLWFIYLNL